VSVATSRNCLSCQSGQILCPVTSRILLTIHEPMYRWKLASTRGGRLPVVMVCVFRNQFTFPACKLCVTFNGTFADDVGPDDVSGIASRSGSRFEPHSGTRFFAPFQTGPVAHTVSCTMYWFHFPGVIRPERGANYWPPSCAESKEFYVPLLPLYAFLASYDIKVDLKRIKVWGCEVGASGSS
jgi:hypothetical protein